MNPEDIARAVSLMVAQGSVNLIAEIVRESKPTRDEIALRFVIAFASAPDAPMYIPQPDGSWLEPKGRENGKSMTTIEVAFGWADAFIAARDGVK